MREEWIEAAAKVAFNPMGASDTGKRLNAGMSVQEALRLYLREYLADALEAALAAAREDGFALMPREITEEMWNAADDLIPRETEIQQALQDDEIVLYEVIPGPSTLWKAMFDAHLAQDAQLKEQQP